MEKRTPSPKIPGIRGFLVVSLILAVVPISCSKKQRSYQENGHPTPVPVLPRKNYDTAKLFNGISLTSGVDCASSQETALGALSDSNTYKMDINLHVQWPRPATTLSDVQAATPEIVDVLPNLGALLQGVTASPDFASLLANKEKSLRANLTTLQRLPYRDSLFDCQTILNLRNPISSDTPNATRTALFVQAIMNVNTDGSDGDRNLVIDKLSPTFQPQTNYRWPKTGAHPNPCIREFEARLALLDAEMGTGTMTPEVKGNLLKERSHVKATIDELKRWDFLVGTADPFVVLPSFMVGKSPGQPSVGDYAVVICRGKLYPAILGDMGPGSKIGECSLRLCREIDPQSGADRRPVSRPEVVYLVFPGTAEKPFTPPDFNHWSERCHALWKEFGGSDYAEWHEWASLEKPWPAPTPSATPDVSPVDSPASTNPVSGMNPATPITPSTSSLPSPSPNR